MSHGCLSAWRWEASTPPDLHLAPSSPLPCLATGSPEPPNWSALPALDPTGVHVCCGTGETAACCPSSTEAQPSLFRTAHQRQRHRVLYDCRNSEESGSKGKQKHASSGPDSPYCGFESAAERHILTQPQVTPSTPPAGSEKDSSCGGAVSIKPQIWEKRSMRLCPKVW